VSLVERVVRMVFFLWLVGTRKEILQQKKKQIRQLVILQEELERL